jgi:hypothetical protein
MVLSIMEEMHFVDCNWVYIGLQVNMLLLLCLRLVGYERIQLVMRGLSIRWYLSLIKFFGCFSWLEMLMSLEALSPLVLWRCWFVLKYITIMKLSLWLQSVQGIWLPSDILLDCVKFFHFKVLFVVISLLLAVDMQLEQLVIWDWFCWDPCCSNLQFVDTIGICWGGIVCPLVIAMWARCIFFCGIVILDLVHLFKKSPLQICSSWGSFRWFVILQLFCIENI